MLVACVELGYCRFFGCLGFVGVFFVLTRMTFSLMIEKQRKSLIYFP